MSGYVVRVEDAFVADPLTLEKIGNHTLPPSTPVPPKWFPAKDEAERAVEALRRGGLEAEVVPMAMVPSAAETRIAMVIVEAETNGIDGDCGVRQAVLAGMRRLAEHLRAKRVADNN